MGQRIVVMKGGVLQQLDAPERLYEKPANVFVAGFIGSPAMNIFPAMLVGDSHRVYVEREALRLRVPPKKADGPHILELEPNGDRSFHDHFHAIGSGCNTAYAIWRTLGGRELAAVNEAKSIQVMLRIMKTCVNVEMWGVNEPFSLWVVSERGARALKADEIEAQLEYVSQWEEKERRVFLHG